MIGDSLTAWNDWQEVVGQHLNHGIPGDTSDGLLFRLERSLSANPDRVILMIGTNDLVQHIPLDFIKKSYTKILEKLTEVKERYVLSVIPVNDAPHTVSINENIIALNHWIKSQADSYGFTYIDLHSKMAQGGVGINPEYTDDGVHLTEEAYAVWEKVLKETMDK
jgi:lysophospholipase L1-like esterase